MISRGMQVLAALLLSSWMLVGSVQAEENPIVSIDISGNRHVEDAAVLAKIKSKVGAPLSRKQVSRDVRKLFASGYFSDIKVLGEPSGKGTKLIFQVVENPVVSSISYEGNDALEVKKLRPSVKLKPGQVYNEAALRALKVAVQRAYLKKGYYQVGVRVEEKQVEKGLTDLIVHIDEGSITTIRRIQFIGNTHYDDKTLRNHLVSSEASLGTWFTDKDIFDKQKFGGDTQKIQMYYMDRGYLDFKIESSQLLATPDHQSFYLLFSLHEGPQYTIRNIDIQGDLTPSKEALQEKLTIESGELYSMTELRKTIDALTEVVGDEGYAFANITPLFKRDPENRTVDIAFDIEKGHQVYIERVEIGGNEKADDAVARREIRQAEAAMYKASDVTRSKERLQRTSLFEDVRVSLPKGSAPDRVNMKVDLKENKSGSFKIGGGYSQLERFFFTISHEEKNFLGKGYNTRISGEIGGRTQNYDFSFTNPYFMGKDVSATFATYKTQTKLNQINTTYNQDNIGGSVGFVIPTSEYFAFSTSYGFTQNKLSNLPANASLYLRAQEGKQTTGEWVNGISYDSRDRTFSPTEGLFGQMSVGYAGLGGTNNFVEGKTSVKHYIPMGDDLVFQSSFAASYIKGMGNKKVPVYRRYSLGGIGSVRGFDSMGISIRDPATQEALGGDKSLTASATLRFPFPYMDESGFNGAVFMDAGTVWGKVNQTLGAQTLSASARLSAANVRVSAGIGIEWVSPIGPLSMAWGFPVRKLQNDVLRSFEFTLGAGL